MLPEIDTLWDFSDPAATERAFSEVLPRARQSGDAGYLAELLSQLARTHSLRGTFERSHALLDEAEGLLGEGPSRAAARVALERGRAHNSAGQKPQALALFRRALAHARGAGEDALALDALHMIAIAETPQNAERVSLEAIALAEASEVPAARRWLGPLYNNLAWAYFDQGRYPESLALQVDPS